MPFGIHRSISLGAEEREAPSLSALLGLGHAPDATANPNQPERTLLPAAHIEESSDALPRHSSLSPEQEGGRTTTTRLSTTWIDELTLSTQNWTNGRPRDYTSSNRLLHKPSRSRERKWNQR